MTASHHDLDLSALDALSTGSGSIARIARDTCEAVTGAVALATCNRFELYVDIDAGLCPPGRDGHVRYAHAAGHLADVVAATSGIDVAVARSALTVRSGDGVPRHLFAVAAGLDSMVVGEREVAGQVRRALAVARESGTTSPALESLFQMASRTSKSVATHTGVGSAGRSLVGVGIELAAARLPHWPVVRALVVGTGSYAGATVAALRAAGCQDVLVYSPSGRAGPFARARQVGVAEDLSAVLGSIDLLVACSGVTGEFVVDREVVAATGRSPDVPTVYLDLALRRDIDPAVADLGVEVIDLAVLGRQAPQVGPAAHDAWQIVTDAAAQFERIQRGRQADADILLLLAEAERQITAEVTEILAGGSAEQSGADRQELERVVRRRVRAALHLRIRAVRAAAVERAVESTMPGG